MESVDPANGPQRAAGALAQPVKVLMSERLISAPASESLAAAAARMSANRVHALLVEPDEAGGRPGVLSAADMLAALGAGEDPEETTVGKIAATELLTIAATAAAAEAAKTMSEHAVSHLFVVEREGGPPIGVVSSIDLARALTRARADGPDAPLVLVAHDAGPGGDDAVALTRLLAADDARVMAAIVVPFPPGEVGDPPLQLPRRADNWEQLCRGLREQGSRALSERALEPLGELALSSHVVLGDSAAAALSVLSESERPDLLVIGSTRRGPLGRVLLGSTGERLAHGSSVPLAIAPHGFAEKAPESVGTIGVGFDGRPESRRALGLAARLARRHAAALKVIAVVDREIGELEIAAQALDALSGAGLDDRRADRLRALAQAALAEEDGVEAAIEVCHGPTPGKLLAACEDGIDLLVLGSRGYGPLARVLLGSVSIAVTRKAPCPVLLAERSS